MPTRKTIEPQPTPAADASTDALQRGRACYERRQWHDAFEALSLADQAAPLGVEDLQRLALSAGLTARDTDMLASQERAYRIHLEAGNDLAAARTAFWQGFRLLALGEHGQASGWLGRAQRIVDSRTEGCVEQGYLLLPASQRHLSAGEHDRAHDCAARAAALGEQFGEADLTSFARNLQGRALLSQGRIDAGIALLDEAMVGATSGELSPVVTGIIYCSAIASCQRVFQFERVREWTAALSAWCDSQPQLGMFTGQCLVHRAEVMEMSGSWPEAVAEAQRAVTRCVRNTEREAAGRAHYQQAEISRLCGEFEAAESAYREASRAGFEPQPGLALLRLAQGDGDAAAAASRRMVGATADRLARIRYLPAHVEIMLAVGDLDEARACSRELQEIAGSVDADAVTAIAARAMSSIHLADGNPGAALEPARRAFAIWQQMGAPYLAARLRVLMARACNSLGDVEGARLELTAAREVFARLGARPDLATVHAIEAGLGAQPANAPAGSHGLSERELQVLRLVATGKTNKAIARELSLSEKTIDRHVSNIFAKLGVATRAAATAFAYENELV